MKRIIRLTESDITRIVRRVINEQDKYIDDLTRPGTDTWKRTTPNKHRVQKGDTLSGIAKDYNTTVDQLIKLNPGIDDPNKIFTGQMINLK